jgi:hypothetical protein
MDHPLTTWYCDECGAKLGQAGGYVIWKDGPAPDFKIIHRGDCDPKGDYDCSAALIDYLGPSGASRLMAMLTAGPLRDRQTRSRSFSDLDAFVDLFRRLQVPYYEEARTYFEDPEVRADYADANEIAPYMPDRLQALIERRGRGT